MTPAQADLEFLENAKKLSMYGVDLHQAKVRPSVCGPTCGFCNLMILPLQEQVCLFWEAALEREEVQKYWHISGKPQELLQEKWLWFLIIYMSQETFQSSSYRQVFSLSNLEYNTHSLPHEPLCSRKCRMGSWGTLWATSRTGEIRRREEVVRKSMKEKEEWPWNWELESGWWGDEFMGKPEG